MRVVLSVSLSLAVLLALSGGHAALARSSGSPRSSAPRRGGSSGRRSGGGGGGGGGPPSSRRRVSEDEEDDDEEDASFGGGLGFDDEDDGDAVADDDEYDEDVDEFTRPPSRRSAGSGRARGGPPPRAASSRGSRGGKSGSRAPPRFEDDDDEEEEYFDEDEEDDHRPPSRSSRRGSGGPSRGSSRGDRSGGGSSRERGPPPSGRSRAGGGGGRPRGNEGRVVSYGDRRGGRRGPPPRQPQPGAFTRGLSSIRDKMPDPAAVRDSLVNTAAATKERTSQLGSNLYREVKGLTSSELEQVMLKATRPDDEPVKSKHVERLVGVTYQISGRYDIYDAVLRKLWNKMAEKDLRTKMKAVYVLHRFSVDGGTDHQEALKQRLRLLRKTKDPKRKTSRYFDSKVLMDSEDIPEQKHTREFLSRYAHYVLTRAQTFGGVFNEISLEQQGSSSPPSRKSPPSKSSSKSAAPKVPPLCQEHLKFSQMVLKAGTACGLRDGEECESTACCVERVAADLMGLTAAVAVALKRELKGSGGKGSKPTDPDLLKRWCEFYSEELMPETKKFAKRSSPKLDAYGLYLPSRIGASVPQELLERGLKGDEEDEDENEEEESSEGNVAEAEEEKKEESISEKVDSDEDEGEGDVSIAMKAKAEEDIATQDEEGDEYDEYEYDDEEYYDDE